MERTIFGDGSGNDFDNVAEIYFGPDHGMVKVGCLASWEHTQPLLKYHTISQGETIHVAMWPTVSPRVANEMGRSHPILWDWTVGWAKIVSFSRGTNQNDPASCLTSHKTKGIFLSLFLATKKWCFFGSLVLRIFWVPGEVCGLCEGEGEACGSVTNNPAKISGRKNPRRSHEPVR